MNLNYHTVHAVPPSLGRGGVNTNTNKQTNKQTNKDTGICITRWKDSKVVTMASTYAGVNPIKKTQRYSKAEKKRVKITQPHVVAEYNYGMGSVDRFNQNIAAYMITQRSKK